MSVILLLGVVGLAFLPAIAAVAAAVVADSKVLETRELCPRCNRYKGEFGESCRLC